jgi:UDP-glucose 4-epimerase
LTQKNKKAVVTGGAGFIGSHIVDELLKRGHEVHVIDNFVAGKSEDRINPKATYHELDVRERTKIAPIIEGADVVFHLAALPRVQFSIDNPEESHDVNINGTLNVLLAARDGKVGKVVYSASSSAYGDQLVLPLSEEMLPQPKSPYALQKYVGEHYCRIFSAIFGLPTVSLRYFNAYGKRADPNGPYAQAIIKFLNFRKQGMPLTVTGDGEQTRDSVHVSDIVRANMLAYEKDTVGQGEVINIGSGRNASVNEVARLIGGEVVYIAPRIEPHDTLADITRAKELLGWEPTVSLEEGIAELKKEFGL